MKMSMATSIIAILLTCSLFVAYGIINTRVMVIKELALVGKLIGNRAGPALEWGDKETAHRSLQDLRIKDSVIIACIYDKDNNVFASYLVNSSSTCPTVTAKEFVSRAWNKLSVYSKVSFHGSDLGAIYIESDIRDIIREIPNYVGFAIILLFIVAIIAYFISAHYQRLIAEPILNLVDVTHAVIEEGQYSSRARKFEDDEIGTLTDSFNKMLSTVQNRDNELKDSNETLEQRIYERTKDLEIAKTKAESANEAKSEFLRNMSHEFRTPLHGILNMATFGIDDVNTGVTDLSALNAYFMKIIKVAERLSGLVEGVLNVAKIENGSEEFNLTKCAVNEIVNVVVEEQQVLFQKKGVELVYNPSSIDTQIMCDRGKIIQVLTNLVGNAVKFTPKDKKVTISIKQDDKYVTFSVNDEGVGIPEAEIEAIFDKFVQSTRTKTGAGGTGLGLAICKGIIKGHNGRIWAENNEVMGSTFRFSIPSFLE